MPRTDSVGSSEDATIRADRAIGSYARQFVAERHAQDQRSASAVRGSAHSVVALIRTLTYIFRTLSAAPERVAAMQQVLHTMVDRVNLSDDQELVRLLTSHGELCGSEQRLYGGCTIAIPGTPAVGSFLCNRLRSVLSGAHMIQLRGIHEQYVAAFARQQDLLPEVRDQLQTPPTSLVSVFFEQCLSAIGEIKQRQEEGWIKLDGLCEHARERLEHIRFAVRNPFWSKCGDDTLPQFIWGKTADEKCPGFRGNKAACC